LTLSQKKKKKKKKKIKKKILYLLNFSPPQKKKKKKKKIFQADLVSASGQRTQGVQGQARHWHVKGIKLKKLADSLEMAPLSPTGKVSKHTKETQSLPGTRLRRSPTFLRNPPSPSPPLPLLHAEDPQRHDYPK